MAVSDAMLNTSMRKLRTIQTACGVSSKAASATTPDVDMSKMSPYQRSQYQIADRLRVMRTLMSELDELPVGGNPTRRVEISNQIRKEDKKMKADMMEARQQAQHEQKLQDYETLQQHYRTTQQLWRARSGGAVAADDIGGGYGSTRGVSKVPSGSIELENALPAAGSYSIRQDEEFALFFQQTQQNDILMDKALDRIQLGVQRLQENATVLSQELKVQSVLLDETERKVDGVTDKMLGLNKKLKQTIKKVDQDKLCMYVFCFIVLLGLAGGIYFVVSGKDKK